MGQSVGESYSHLSYCLPYGIAKYISQGACLRIFG